MENIKNLYIDTSQNKNARMLRYVQAVQDPYSFYVGDTAVSVRYGIGGSLQESITKLIINNYSGKTDVSML